MVHNVAITGVLSFFLQKHVATRVFELMDENWLKLKSILI